MMKRYIGSIYSGPAIIGVSRPPGTRLRPPVATGAVLIAFSLAMIILASACTGKPDQQNTGQRNAEQKGIPVIFDTDANNELDDQHALAYLLLNGDTFDVLGITVNATLYGGGIDGHYKEAERIMTLCGLQGEIPILKGAEAGFREIREHTGSSRFDGSEAVSFIVEQAGKEHPEPLLVIAVGKLTNLALAVKKDPSLTGRIRIIWLGSNYPEPGEYNQNNDTAALNYLLGTEVPFEMVTVRYGQPSGTAAVTVTQQEINERMPGLGPHIPDPVTGRHGGRFNNFGDYSVSLFEHIEYDGEPRQRSLYDMAAVAIVKNPAWASSRVIPCPVLTENRWVEQPDNPRTIRIRENFHTEEIIGDFFRTLEKHTPEPN